MLSTSLLEGLEFHDQNPYAQPLYVDRLGRVLRFTLKPGQSIVEHSAPHSPFYVIVLKGQGLFTGGDGQAYRFGPSSLLIFDPGENHSIQALDEELVFVGVLHGAPDKVTDEIGGTLARSA
jgi:quercetin dioxygenase-like cupin family protein